MPRRESDSTNWGGARRNAGPRQRVLKLLFDRDDDLPMLQRAADWAGAPNVQRWAYDTLLREAAKARPEE